MFSQMQSHYIFKAANSRGNMWPVYGQPVIMRTIGSYLPATIPTTAASAIGAKGLSYMK